MKHYRGYAALLALLCAASVITACGDDSTATPTGTEQGSASAAEEETTSRWQDALPADIDLGGETVVIHVRGGTQMEVDVAEEDGDVFNDAVYLRNRALEERLNCTITAFEGAGWESYGDELTRIRASIAAGDNAWQIIAIWGIQSSPLVLENCFYDLTDMPYLDETAPWWNQSLVTELTLGGGRYFMKGDLAVTTMLGGSSVMFVNDTLCQQYDVESIPALVREGKWTVDKMAEIAKMAVVDLDGSGVMDENDQYGLVLDQANSADAFYTSADIHQIKIEDGLPVYVPNVERITTLMDKIYPLYFGGEENGSLMLIDTTEQTNKFINGQAMMIVRELSTATTKLRDMEDDYTIVPTPKLDEAQENYLIAGYNGAAIFGIPSDNPAPDSAVIVLEAMAAAAHKETTPVYFKTCLQEKYARNEETLEMLELIRSSLFLDAEFLWSDSLNGTGYIVRDLIYTKKKDAASAIAKAEKRTAKTIENTIEKLLDMQDS